jgi:2,4-dienoyl-CoA reductase-like NADH-dependent reductase (Old Yellow Enzyme family)/thioredoxin reductase
MERMFEKFKLDGLELANRFVFPPVKTGYGTPNGEVTQRQLLFYQQISENGPGIVILEPVAVTLGGREHPKQLSVHLPGSAEELKKIADVIHKEHRLACLHLNHAGAAANPKAAGTTPKAPSSITCPTTGEKSEPMTPNDIDSILAGYKSAAAKALEAGFDLIEIQAGHGYLISQFLNKKINKRTDQYGRDRLAFAREVFSAVKQAAPKLPLMLRISGNEMSPEFGIEQDDLIPLFELAQKAGVCAVHVGMGSACFSPPWYFHHSSLPEKPQIDALTWVRKQTSLPVIAAGRLGRKEKILEIMSDDLADLIALGRPLLADPDFVAKWQKQEYEQVMYCGYCLQGCLHRMKNGQPLGCNLNPELGLPGLQPADKPLNVLVAGGGPAGMSAALYLARRGHCVTLADKDTRLGGQFNLTWQAPGKEKMKDGLETLEREVKAAGVSVFTHQVVNADLVQEIQPNLLVWAVGAVQNIPKIDGLETQSAMTAVEYFQGNKTVKGPRVLVIGAGRAGLEIAEKLGKEGFEVVATKRTDPIGSFMEMITRNLTLKRISAMPGVTLMPHTRVKTFRADGVEVIQDEEKKTLAPFQTVILAAGMLSAAAPAEDIKKVVPKVEILGDAHEVQDIFSAVHAGYELASRY